VNISSATPFHYPRQLRYAPAKGAIEVLTHYSLKNSGHGGITPMWRRWDHQTNSRRHVRDNPEINKYISAMTALGARECRMTSGRMIAALLSDENGGEWPENRSLGRNFL